MTVYKGAANIFALACIQGSNALVPILIFPYALKVLGAAPYANVALAEAISNVVLALVLYSFDVEGVSRVSGLDHERDRRLIAKTYWDIIYARLAIFAIAALVTLVLVGAFSGHWPIVMALWLLIPLGYVFHGFWLYQSLEKNRPAAFFVMAGRGASVALVFSGLNSPAEGYVVPLSIGGAFLASGLASMAYVVGVLRLPITPPDRTDILAMLNHGKEIFFSNVGVVLYRGSNLLILGAIGAGASSIATYSLAEKSTMMLQATTRPLTQFFFPRMVRRLRTMAAPEREAAGLIWKLTLPQIAVMFVIFAALGAGFTVLSLFTPLIASYPGSARIVPLVVVMSPSILFGIGNFMFGTVGLNFLNARRYYLIAILVTGVVNLAACYTLGTWLGALGAAFAFAGAETLLFIIVILKYREPARVTRLSSPSDGLQANE